MLPLRDLTPRKSAPVVTVALIAVNLAAFAYELSLGPQLEAFLTASAFVPARSLATGAGDLQALPALVSMFLHGGWAHLLGNMLFLWIFGDNVEDRLGHLRFAAFYLLCGYAAAWAHAFSSPASTVPAIGASGAIAGVLGAYVVLHPRGQIDTLVFLGFWVDHVRVPALLYLPLWFVLQLVSGVASLGASSTAEAGGVAWFAHVGGFVAGPVLLVALGGLRRVRRR